MLLFLIAIAANAETNFLAVEFATASPPKLVSAQTKDHHWRTALMLTLRSNATAPQTVHIQNDDISSCPTPDVTIKAGGAAYIRDLAYSYFCGGSEFELFTPPVGVDSFTVLSFDDGATRSSFSLPAIGAISSSQRFGPIVSDSEEGTWITTFPKQATPITVEVYDGNGAKVATELYETGIEVNQYQVKARVSVGFVVVTLGWPGFTGYPPLTGFVSSGTHRGGNFRAFPFGQ